MELLESASSDAPIAGVELRKRLQRAAALVAPDAPELGRIIEAWGSIAQSEYEALASFVESLRASTGGDA